MIFCLSAVLLSSCSSLKQSSQGSRYLKVEKKWAKATLDAPNLGAQVFNRMKPILAGEILIVGNSVDGLKAINKFSGKTLWRKDIKGGVEAGALLFNGHLLFGAGDGNFYKIKAIDGETVWSFSIQSEGLSLPTVQGGKVYFMAGNGIVHCLELKTGKSIWRYNRGNASYLSVRGGSQPLVANNLVFVGFNDGYLVALRADKGVLAWEKRINKNKKFRDIDAKPVIAGNSLIVSSFDGDLVSVDVSSGDLRWKSKYGGYASPIIADNRIYVSSSKNYVAAIDKDSGRAIWTYPTRSLTTKPQLYSGLIVTGEFNGSLKFLDSETGKLVREFYPGRGVHSQVTIDKDEERFYFMSADANLFSLQVGWERRQSKWPWESYE